MNDNRLRWIAAIGASAVVMFGAVALSISQDPSKLGADAGSGMATAATVTQSVDTSASRLDRCARSADAGEAGRGLVTWRRCSAGDRLSASLSSRLGW